MVATTPDSLPRDPNGNASSNNVRIIDSPTGTSESIPSIGQPGQTFYWEVQAIISGVNNGWSPIWSYTLAGELHRPPLIQGAAVTPSTVTRGDAVTLTASGVSDPNVTPGSVTQVIWYRESNGVPGLQTSYPGGDANVAQTTDGSNGWQTTFSTFGWAGLNGPGPGTYTLYAAAVDNLAVFSTGTPGFTFTVLPASVPAPAIQSVEFDPASSPASVRITFNTNVAPSLMYAGGGLIAGRFQLAGPGNPQVQGISYDPATNAATLTFGPTPLVNGDYELTTPLPQFIYNANGVSLQQPLTFDFFVLAGDANRDRTVDSQDYSIFLQNMNTGGGKGWADGDFNGDGVVDSADLQILQGNMGQTLPPLAGAPNTPTNASPSDAQTSVDLAPTLVASAFADPNTANTQIASQ